MPGRNTYDQVKKFGQWPYKGKRAYVLSSNQISTSRGEAKRADAASKLIPRLRMLDDGGGWSAVASPSVRFSMPGR